MTINVAAMSAVAAGRGSPDRRNSRLRNVPRDVAMSLAVETVTSAHLLRGLYP